MMLRWKTLENNLLKLSNVFTNHQSMGPQALPLNTEAACGSHQGPLQDTAPQTDEVLQQQYRPCARKTVRPRSAGAFRAGETQILSSGDAFCVALRRENNCRDAFFVALRRRNANFDLRRFIFCGPAQAKRKFWPPETHLLSRWSGFTRSQNRMGTWPLSDLQRTHPLYPVGHQVRYTDWNIEKIVTNILTSKSWTCVSAERILGYFWSIQKTILSDVRQVIGCSRMQHATSKSSKQMCI